MIEESDVSGFLVEFHAKMNIWDIVFVSDSRAKNTQALLDLEISSNERKDVIKALKVEDYSDGPIQDKVYHGSDLWVFGKIVKEREIYIKISLGNQSSSKVICISFHEAEHEMDYPFKNQ